MSFIENDKAQLDAAVRETSDYLNKQLPKGNKLVILNIQSEYPALSEYIIDELIANTVNDRVFSVVDRRQLDSIRAELDFQMSGEVSDETAQSVGQLTGAQIIVSGAVSKIGDLYRLRVRALSVQSAEIEGQFNRNIPDGSTIAALVKSKATGYGGGSGYGGSGGGTATAAKPGAAPAGQAAPAPAPQPATAPAAPASTPAAPAPVTAPAPKVYKIGDTGPAGGLIFYDKGNNSDGGRYLEAAPKSAETQAQWGMDGSTVGRTKTEVGMGKANTDFIMRAMLDREESGRAAQLARQCKQGGYGDWFLPSKDELNLMYKNLKTEWLGGFSEGSYWSSSENGNHLAWYQSFSAGSQDTIYKNYTYSVRAIRAFRGNIPNSTTEL